ncbi:acyl-CoA dehydrogenase family protein [Mycobacterium sp.]|uniref:acyl-CoA dehydrogenase family protein n=1 Tax=Mycobacterium sp. TaxID=1785 RepID=UPI001229C8D1|nr:acyl-CoA dehydrogenase family protein [Mycobacterium sp.]TAM65114.1 MAG: acyl-CoA dehydrogenase [Mycobacterium sp.]
MNPSVDTTGSEWTLVEEAVFRLFAELGQREEHVAIGERLAELGWSDIETEYPIAACELLFRAQGRYLTTTDCLDRVILAEITPVLGAVDGVVLPALDGDESDAGQVRGMVAGTPRGRLAVAIPNAGNVSLAVLNADELDCRRLDTFDPSVHWTSVTGPIPPTVTEGSAHWTNALGAARRALATELIALGDEALRLAIEHVTARTQFGAQIGSFQSPRHALAQAFAELEGARALLNESWRFGGTVSAQAAKAAAGRAHRAVADVALQVCGAIGVTAEHELHRYVRRGMQLDSLCGSYALLEAELAEQLFERSRQDDGLPTIVSCG